MKKVFFLAVTALALLSCEKNATIDLEGVPGIWAATKAVRTGGGMDDTVEGSDMSGYALVFHSDGTGYVTYVNYRNLFSDFNTYIQTGNIQESTLNKASAFSWDASGITGGAISGLVFQSLSGKSMILYASLQGMTQTMYLTKVGETQ